LNTFAQAVQSHAEETTGIRVLSLECLDKLARDYGLSRREAELAALELGILPRRYLRNCGTVGMDGQLLLLRSCVAVIGLGGLGGYIVEGLARMGVGRLVLVDGDVFCDHNLNRQVLSQEDYLGRAKVEVAGERVREINGAVEVALYDEYASRDNLSDILRGVDVVVDALDRLPTRLMLQEMAAQAAVPLVHGAIAGGMGQVMTILPGDGGVRALYGDGPVPEHGAEAELGTPPASPMMVAAWQVHEVVKILTGKGELLRGRLLFLDAMTSEVRVFDLGT
jgi:molybdopterin/thiamine biosynthesis adenylyltransferase